jgi:hypothetical protein
LRAALAPAQTDYLYFVANTQGGHFFAATLVEHNPNVNRYHRLLAGLPADAPEPEPDPDPPVATPRATVSTKAHHATPHQRATPTHRPVAKKSPVKNNSGKNTKQKAEAKQRKAAAQ